MWSCGGATAVGVRQLLAQTRDQGWCWPKYRAQGVEDRTEARGHLGGEIARARIRLTSLAGDDTHLSHLCYLLRLLGSCYEVLLAGRGCKSLTGAPL
jgi:hypothetical protein